MWSSPCCALKLSHEKETPGQRVRNEIKFSKPQTCDGKAYEAKASCWRRPFCRPSGTGAEQKRPSPSRNLGARFICCLACRISVHKRGKESSFSPGCVVQARFCSDESTARICGSAALSSDSRKRRPFAHITYGYAPQRHDPVVANRAYSHARTAR